MYYLMVIIEWLLRPFHRYYEKLLAATASCEHHSVVWYYYTPMCDAVHITSGEVDCIDDYPIRDSFSVAVVTMKVPWYWRRYVSRKLLRHPDVWAVLFQSGHTARKANISPQWELPLIELMKKVWEKYK